MPLIVYVDVGNYYSGMPYKGKSLRVYCKPQEGHRSDGCSHPDIDENVVTYADIEMHLLVSRPDLKKYALQYVLVGGQNAYQDGCPGVPPLMFETPRQHRARYWAKTKTEQYAVSQEEIKVALENEIKGPRDGFMAKPIVAMTPPIIEIKSAPQVFTVEMIESEEDKKLKNSVLGPRRIVKTGTHESVHCIRLPCKQFNNSLESKTVASYFSLVLRCPECKAPAIEYDVNAPRELVPTGDKPSLTNPAWHKHIHCSVNRKHNKLCRKQSRYVYPSEDRSLKCCNWTEQPEVWDLVRAAVTKHEHRTEVCTAAAMAPNAAAELAKLVESGLIKEYSIPDLLEKGRNT